MAINTYTISTISYSGTVATVLVQPSFDNAWPIGTNVYVANTTGGLLDGLRVTTSVSTGNTVTFASTVAAQVTQGGQLTILPSDQPYATGAYAAYMFSQAPAPAATGEGTWYPIAGLIDTNATYDWTGVNRWNASAYFNKGQNVFHDLTALEAAIPVPVPGTTAFLLYEDTTDTSPLNIIVYWDAVENAWVEISGGGGGGVGFFLMGG